MLIDWSLVITYLLVGLAGAASAIAAAYSKRAAAVVPVLTRVAPVRLALTERVTVPALLGAGGSNAEIAATLTPWYPLPYLPAWSQNDGSLPDGNQDPEHFLDCGETCVAMLVAGVHGCPIEPGSIRQYLHGTAGSGLTSGADLIRALKYYSIAAHVESIGSQHAWDVMTAMVASQRAVIMLGRWPTPGLALHWMIAVSDGSGVVQYINPWTGGRSFLNKVDWLNVEAGQLVILDAHVHYDCRTWPVPS